MHTANRPPTTRHPSALRIRPAQLTPRCARRLAGTRVDGFFARCVPCRSSSRPPCLGGAEAARGGAAGSSWVRVRHVAHPRIAPYCRLPSWPLGADCRRGCGAADAPAVRRAWGGRGPLGGGAAGPSLMRAWHVAWGPRSKKMARAGGRLAVSCRARVYESME